MQIRNIHEYKIINNQESRSSYPFPTLKDCAELAYDAYDTEKNSMHGIEGWECFKVSDKYDPYGYFGKCYIKNWNTSDAILVFSHRGTQPIWENFKGDLKILFEKSPQQCRSAISFVWSCLELLKIFDSKTGQLHIQSSLTQVGHSLGGLIANTATSSVASPENLELYSCVTFENPGAKKPMEDFWRQILPSDSFDWYFKRMLSVLSTRGVTYQAGVNLINSCNEQVVKAYRIENLVPNYSTTLEMLPFPPTSLFSSNPFYIVNNTADQHRMGPIVKAIASREFKYHEIENIHGLQNGYTEYLNPTNKVYWDGYLQHMWDSSVVLRLMHHNNYDEYYQDGNLKLKSVYETAQRGLPSLNNVSVLPNSLFKQTPKPTTEQIMEEFYMLNPKETKPGYCPIM